MKVGAPLTWTNMPVVYRFSIGSQKLNNTAAKKAIRAAFDTWQQVECPNGKRTSLRFQEQAQISTVKPLKDSGQASVPFGIYFRDEEWPHSNADETLALTTLDYGEITGNITYADMEINTAENDFDVTGTADVPDADASTALSPNYDMQLVITHEVGHYVGLAHSQRNESIMVARYCQSADRCSAATGLDRGLSDDDITAVCALYPPDGKSIATGNSGQSSGCNVTDSRSDVGTMGLAFAALVAVRRIRKRNQG